MFIEKEKVDKVMVYSDMLFREIALRTDSLGYYDKYSSNQSALKNLYKHSFIYSADMDISDYYIKKFNEEFDPDINYKLHKCFFDIEVDLMPNGFMDRGYSGFPDESVAPCPINIITLIDGKTLDGYIFICKNKLNSQLLEYENQLEENIEELKNEISSEEGIFMNKINTIFYDAEELMIEGFFKKVHEIDPDYLCAWNEGFDVLTLQNRLLKLYKSRKDLRELGIKPYDKMVQTISDPKYMVVKDQFGNDIYLTPKAYYKQNKEKTIVDRMDEFTSLDGIIYMDQMLLFANVRKGKMRESYSLDSIANEVLGKEKLDYEGYTIKNLAWLNFKKFVKYNFKDTLLLYMLEEENLDIDLIQRISTITNTRVYKAFKKTICLKNFVSKFAEMQGFIMNNNKNSAYGDDAARFLFENEYMYSTDANGNSRQKIVEGDQTYAQAFTKRDNYGAYVGDPNLNDYCGVISTGGKRSMFLFENVFDEDFSSLYPSIIRAYNLDKNTQVGKYYLFDKHIKEKLLNEYDYDGLFTSSKNDEAGGVDAIDDIGPTLVDSLISHDWNKIGNKYFDLPLTTDLIEDLRKRKEEK